MLPLSLFDQLGRDKIVLIAAAHCDDVALGCGGMLLRCGRGSGAELRSIVFCGCDPVRAAEERAAGAAFGLARQDIFDYRDGSLPEHRSVVREHLLAVREEIGSSRIALVLAPRLEDRHPDHRLVAENVWRVFRDHLVLEYEIMKYDGDFGHLNFYVPLAAEIAEAKIAKLMTSYPSRRIHRWWHEENFRSLLRIRGLECNASFAEGFTARKLVAGPTDD
jgi:LmbE family N-acetylglucosaminyl deacetylase